MGIASVDYGPGFSDVCKIVLVVCHSLVGPGYCFDEVFTWIR